MPESREALREAIVAGAADNLSGLRESDWFDAKGAPYRLDEDEEKYELAKDVTAFANAQGGILLIPVTTVFDANGELVERVKDADLALLDPDRVRKVIRQWVEPGINGLEVLVVPTAAGRGRLMINVPPQAPELWPHIITRGTFDRLIHTVGVAICVRSGPDISTLSAPAVHALLAEGQRARKLGGQLRQVAAAADPPAFEPTATGSGSFNQHAASGAFNANLSNHGGSAAFVQRVQLESPFGLHDGVVWLADDGQAAPSAPPIRVPRGAHLQMRFEDKALVGLEQAGGQLTLRLVYEQVTDPAQASELTIELLRQPATGGRLRWRAGRQKITRLGTQGAEQVAAVNDVLDELATLRLRVENARSSGRYPYDFFLPALEYHEHKASLPSNARDLLRDVYVPADDLNGLVRSRGPDGSEVQDQDSLDHLVSSIELARALLGRLIR